MSLVELSVQNLALIEDVRVELQPGFCAWTGETGAGKSLLLGALGLLLGERGSADLLRAGADELRVTGRFELSSPLVRREIESILDGTLEDDEIILARRLHRNGRSHAYANDRPVVLATLKQIGNILVDIHGQRETESLLHPAYQLQLLDAYGHLDAPRRKYLTLAERVRDLRRRRQALSTERQQRQRELALLRFEREELDEANLSPGEIAELSRERDRLIHAQNLQAFAVLAAGELYDDDGSMVERLGIQACADCRRHRRRHFFQHGVPRSSGFLEHSRFAVPTGVFLPSQSQRRRSIHQLGGDSASFFLGNFVNGLPPRPRGSLRRSARSLPANADNPQR